MDPFDALEVFTVGAFAGLLVGTRLGWHAALLLTRPLPRPWRRVAGWYRRLAGDTWRLLETGRWT